MRSLRQRANRCASCRWAPAFSLKRRLPLGEAAFSFRGHVTNGNRLSSFENFRTEVETRLQTRRPKRVALIRVAGLQALLEPGRALRRGAVGEAFGDDVTLGAFLQAVVADGARRRSSLLRCRRPLGLSFASLCGSPRRRRSNRPEVRVLPTGVCFGLADARRWALTWSEMPSRVWTWWPISCAIT